MPRLRSIALALSSSALVVALSTGCVSNRDSSSAGVDPNDLGLVVVAAVGDLAASMEGVERVALHPNARRAEPGACRSPTVFARLADDALAQVFRGRGYTLVDEAPDVWLAYTVGMNGRVESPDLAHALGIEVGEQALANEQRSGVALSLLSVADGRVLWRATDDEDLRRTSYDADETAARLRSRFEVLLADLPQAGE